MPSPRKLLRRPLDTALHIAGDDRREQYLEYRQQSRFDQFMQDAFGGFYQPLPVGPIPPAALVETTACLHEEELERSASAHAFEMTGRAHLMDFLAALTVNGVNLRTVGRVLDFGCGTARLLRHLRSVDGIDLVGTDADQRVVDWCREHLDGIRFETNELEPPLAHAESDTFDLVISYSVFTHIPLDQQRPWLEEMARIIRPGGHLTCTVIGRHHINEMLTDETRAQVARGDSIELDGNSPNASHSTKVLGSWDIFQSRSVVLDIFREHFEVVDYRSAVQDILVLRRR